MSPPNSSASRNPWTTSASPVYETSSGAGLDAPIPCRAELLHVLMLPDPKRVGMIQSYWGNPTTRTFGELLIGPPTAPAALSVPVTIHRN